MTDGGILVNRCFQPTGNKTHRHGFMPHIHHANFAEQSWQQICGTVGIRYIDPRWPIEQILTAISEVDVLLAEAMHGAIVADALRTAWIPVITSPRILRFKWQDWCASMAIPYRPQYLAPLVADYPRYAQGIRSYGRAIGHWSRIVQHSPSYYVRDTLKGNRDRLRQIINNTAPCLSKERISNHLSTSLEEQLGILSDYD